MSVPSSHLPKKVYFGPCGICSNVHAVYFPTIGNLSVFLLIDVLVHALDTTWELHKPYLQKSTLLSSLLKRAEMTGMRNIEEEEEEDLPEPGETGTV